LRKPESNEQNTNSRPYTHLNSRLGLFNDLSFIFGSAAFACGEIGHIDQLTALTPLGHNSRHIITSVKAGQQLPDIGT
jgi:hypothetical protein